MNGRITFLAVVSAILFASAPAFAECTCRANGQNYAEGQLACIHLPSGSYIARCGKVLNNTSWVKVSDGCPQANAIDPPSSGIASKPPASRLTRTNG